MMRAWHRLAVAFFFGLGCGASDDESDTATGQDTGAMDGPGATNTSAADEFPDDGRPDSSDGGGVITNACGTFEQDGPTDSEIPQDPDDPEIIAACTAKCDAVAGLADCRFDAATCLDSCKLRSCGICPGTLAPLVQCETEMLDLAACTCDQSGPACPTPEGCDALSDATTMCGG